MLSYANLHNGDDKNSNGEDLERSRIKNLIKGFELEEMGVEKKLNPQPDNSLRFVLDICNSNLCEKNYSNPIESNKEINSTNPENEVTPIFELCSDNTISEECKHAPENPFESIINQGQDSFSGDDMFLHTEEIIEKEKDNEEALRSFSINKLESISNKDEKSALIFSYIKMITDMSSKLEEKHFLAGSNNDIAQAKVIGGVTYINYAATAHVYSIVMDEIRKNRLDAAESGLKLICLLSLDPKYVNLALNTLKDNKICSESDFVDIVNKTIEKEKILISTIKQLRRIISDVS